MNTLSKDKRNQLVLVVLATAGVLAGLWFGLIRTQQQSLEALAQRKTKAEQKLQQVKQAIEMADVVEGQLEEGGKRLAKSACQN
jgi:Tfp pilus assembly protein PilO